MGTTSSFIQPPQPPRVGVKLPKLYYTSTSCGAANFIAAWTAKVNLLTEQVDLQTHKTTSGEDFYKINPKGNVPALVLEDGTVLNENGAVAQWIADRAPNTIAPVNGTSERYAVQNLMSYISSEVHGSIGPLFYPNHPADVENTFRSRVDQKLTYVENNLLNHNEPFLVGNQATIADFYLYIVLTWTDYLKVDLAPYPKVKAFKERVGNLPNVKEANARMAKNPSTVLSLQ